MNVIRRHVNTSINRDRTNPLIHDQVQNWVDGLRIEVSNSSGNFKIEEFDRSRNFALLKSKFSDSTNEALEFSNSKDEVLESSNLTRVLISHVRQMRFSSLLI
jgi:hypothetical protein